MGNPESLKGTVMKFHDMPPSTKWPKIFPPLTEDQRRISDDFMKHWHYVVPRNKFYGLADLFNQHYAVKHAPREYLRTLEIGAGIGEHLEYEHLTDERCSNYFAMDIRSQMLERLHERFPKVQAILGDCQERTSFVDEYFDRIIAVHVLEHLPNLPAAVREMYRVCSKPHGVLSVVIPCEGGTLYSLCRRISAQRIFEKRYKQSYRWFIEREHVNQPCEIMEELQKCFLISHEVFFPLLLPFVDMNLAIGLTLYPKEKQ